MGIRILLSLFLLPVYLPAQTSDPATAAPVYTYQEIMVPVRDGVHLQTVILTPVNQKEPLPILLKRSPYGVPDKAPTKVPTSLKELDADGYIYVFQNLRGRFKSEGKFTLASDSDLSDPKGPNEATDAYDTIEWLIHHVPKNNGRVGMYGVSYDGFTTAVALLDPHPALKAISEQASPADQWMNDDFHRYGALRESYAFEYSVLEEADKNKNTNFDFNEWDTFKWYLDLGPLGNVNARFLHGSLPFWNDNVAHPNYDAFWQKEAWYKRIKGATIPNLNVAGFYDQEDPWGPWQIFRMSEKDDPQHQNFIVAGPWCHGCWRQASGDKMGLIEFGGHATAREYREQIEAPFFRYYLHGSGAKPDWQAATFETGSNTWQHYAQWPPREAKPTSLYLHANGTLSFDPPKPGESASGYRQYISDPANPVPYRRRPISPTYPGEDWRYWEFADQRFVDDRPDVLTFTSAPLEHDIRITGEVAADLFASTSGTDSDFVVKLIDVYPEDAQKKPWGDEGEPKRNEFAESLNGYELPIAMEVRRGRFNQSYEQPAALAPNQPTEFKVPLRDRDHVFLKGHRIMVQVQSTWFPVIDRNPQKFVPSIYEAKPEDFVIATQRVYVSPERASHVVLPIVSTP